LRKQATELGISPKQSPPVLRQNIIQEHQNLLIQHGSDANLTPIEMRKRRRILELIETAKFLSQNGHIPPLQANEPNLENKRNSF